MKNSILIFVDYFYPGTGGAGPAKSICNFISENQFLNFHIITRGWDLDKYRYKPNEINNFLIDSKLNCNYIKSYFSYFCFLFKEIFANNFKKYYFNSFFSIFFTLIPIIFNKIFYKKEAFLAPRGELFSDVISHKYLKKYIYIYIFKFLNLDKSLIFIASNELESKSILVYFKNSKIIIINDGLNIGDFKLNLTKIKKIGFLKLIFISRINHKKNLRFAVDLLKNLDANIIFDIYGINEDPAYLNECFKVMKSGTGSVTFNYLGPIGYSMVRDTISKYDLLILPSFGENFCHVIAESLLSNTPVLISDRTPWMSDKYGVVSCLSLDSFQEWHDKIHFFLNMDNNQYLKILNSFADYLNSINLRKDYRMFYY